MTNKPIIYPLAEETWDNLEIEAIQSVIDSRKFTMGERVLEFEKEFARYFGSKFAVFSNSGSSANLLAIASLIYTNRLKKGDEVIVPAVSWSTTYYPLHQYGLKIKFVDVDINTLNANLENITQAITTDTKAVLVVNLLGNPSQLSEITKLCKGKKIILIEDNCESLGAKYNEKYAGTFGVLGTFSTYFSHHISTIEGGLTVTNDVDLYHTMISLRAHGWTRGLPINSKIYERKSNEFYEQFNFILPGYNLRPTEIQAAIGLEQIKKIPRIIVQRRLNAKHFINSIHSLENFITQFELGESSWFGFSILLSGNLEGKRDKLIETLTNNGIECRPIVAGNFTLNKVIDFFDYQISHELLNASKIHYDGFFVGNHSFDNKKNINKFIDILREFNEES